jgi:hypothetical protein
LLQNGLTRAREKKRKEKKVNKRDYYSLCAHARMEKEQNNPFFLNFIFRTASP